MNRKLSSAILAGFFCLSTLTGCDKSYEAANIWSQGIQKYNLSPVYLPKEDYQVGDLYLYGNDPFKKLSKANPQNIVYLRSLLFESENDQPHLQVGSYWEKFSNYYKNRMILPVTTDTNNLDTIPNATNIDSLKDGQSFFRAKRVVFPSIVINNTSTFWLQNFIPIKMLVAGLGYGWRRTNDIRLGFPNTEEVALPTQVNNSITSTFLDPELKQIKKPLFKILEANELADNPLANEEICKKEVISPTDPDTIRPCAFKHQIGYGIDELEKMLTHYDRSTSKGITPTDFWLVIPTKVYYARNINVQIVNSRAHSFAGSVLLPLTETKTTKTGTTTQTETTTKNPYASSNTNSIPTFPSVLATPASVSSSSSSSSGASSATSGTSTPTTPQTPSTTSSNTIDQLINNMTQQQLAIAQMMNFINNNTNITPRIQTGASNASLFGEGYIGKFNYPVAIASRNLVFKISKKPDGTYKISYLGTPLN